MKITKIFIEKIQDNNAAVADLATTLNLSLSRTLAVISENKRNGHLTTEAAMRIICYHTAGSREEILEECPEEVK